MKILFLIPHVFIPLNRGNKQLIYYLLKYVTEHADCEIALLTDPSDNKDDVIKRIRTELPGVNNIRLFDKPAGKQRSLSRLKALLYGYPPAIGNYWSGSLAKWLASTDFQRFDIVHFDMFYMAQYRKYCKDVPALLVPSDAYSLSAMLVRKAVTTLKEKIRMMIAYMLIRNHEKSQYSYFDMVCPVAKTDTDYLSTFIERPEFRTIGVAIGEDIVAREPRKWEESNSNGPCDLLYIGPVSQAGAAEGLRLFIERSFPRICEVFPDTRLVVLGPDPLVWLKDIFDADQRIVHIDFVDDYLGFLDKDWIYVHPQRTNAGFQTKVQQAMAIGLPVVGFDLAFTGMRSENNKHCFICGSMDEFAENILKLLQSASLRRRVGLVARELICSNYSIENVGREIMENYRSLIK